MNFPVWDVGFGLPLLIALVAIPHVMVAHFAIGGGLFLAIYEARARKTNDYVLLGYVRTHSRFFMLLTLVFGAITGVGIWFTIGLISPGATSSLIHTFVWFWATEWVMFFVEIAASLVYYYGWDKLDAKTHQKVMWVYFIAAWGSLAVINGIITFMLTSGTWVQDRNIWLAFFNPTYFPSLIFRTLLCLLMAGIFAFLTAAFQRNDKLRATVNRIAAMWTIPTILLLAVTGYWYLKSLPETTMATIAGGWIALDSSKTALVLLSVMLLIVILLTMVIKHRIAAQVLTVIMVITGLKVFGAFEWYREAARKPYVIAEYMYSNGILASDTTAIKAAGLTASVKWKRNDPAYLGEDLFRAVCQSCHSLSGYSGIARMTANRGWTEDQLAGLVFRSGYLRGPMPPFLGTTEEAAAIAGYIHKNAKALRITAKPLSAEQIWSNNCGLCHEIDGFRPLRAALSGMSATDLKDVILTVDQLSEAMPPFMGSDEDAGKLAAHLESILSTTKAEGAK